MSKRTNRKDSPQIDFWQSATDLSLAFALVMLLLVALLLLYILRLPERDHFLLWGTEANYQERDGDGDYDEEEDDLHGRYDEIDYDDGGGGGEGGEGFEEDEFHYLYPIPSAGGGDDEGKAAVYLNIIDAETLRAIREEGVTFELYEVFDYMVPRGENGEEELEPHGAIRFLNTYYPYKIEYRKFETTDEGNFYLPEKIEENEYYFKQITEPTGYDSAGTILFDVDDDYDWPDPFVVSVPLYPARNTIHVRLIDEKTGERLSGGSFVAVAAEDIVTADQTLRFSQGQEADRFLTQTETGEGESAELYLGNYLVSQGAAPAYYTTTDEVVEAEVTKKDGRPPVVYEFLCQKTAIVLRLTDDLTGQPLQGATFTLTANGSVVKNGQTDASGNLVFTELDKNTSYTLQQTAATAGYEPDGSQYTYYVDMSGRIEQEAEAGIALTNYIPRTEIAIQDILLHTPIRDRKISLYDSRDQMLHTWNTGSSAESITNLPEGEYYVTFGNSSARHRFTVLNSRQVTHIDFSVWSLYSILTLVLGALLIPLLIWLLMRLFAGRKNKNNGTSD